MADVQDGTPAAITLGHTYFLSSLRDNTGNERSVVRRGVVSNVYCGCVYRRVP